jgi:hypothetical protein
VTVHPFHPVVVIIGVFFALRRMSLSLRTAEEHPGVDAAAFERWRTLARRAYGLGMSACFGKVLLDYALAYLFERLNPPMPVARAIGISVELGWVALVVMSYLRVRAARKVEQELGIERRAEK